jgi:hypothetical protein
VGGSGEGGSEEQIAAPNWNTVANAREKLRDINGGVGSVQEDSTPALASFYNTLRAMHNNTNLEPLIQYSQKHPQEFGQFQRAMRFDAWIDSSSKLPFQQWENSKVTVYRGVSVGSKETGAHWTLSDRIAQAFTKQGTAAGHGAFEGRPIGKVVSREISPRDMFAYSNAQGEYEVILRGLRSAGGAGSGNFGHAGRPGEVGGSGEGGESSTGVSFEKDGRWTRQDYPLFKEKVASYRATLAPEEVTAIKAYKGGMFGEINGFLRTGEMPLLSPTPVSKIEGYIKNLDKAVRVPVEKDIVVYRGGKLMGGVGSIITDKAFVSTSLVREKAEKFVSVKRDKLLWEITVPKGAHIGLPFGTAPTEFEVLLQRGSQFRITGIEKNVVRAEMVR